MSGDTVFHRKIVKPHNNMMEEMDEHDLRKTSVREGTDDAPTAFFDNHDMPFNVTDMFQCSSNVQRSMMDMVLDFFEFIVH